MAIRTNDELLAANDAAYTANPILPASVKSFNGDCIDSKEHLIPMLTTAQRDLIATPAQRQLIYNVDIQSYEFWDTVAWRAWGGAANGTPAIYIHKFTTSAGVDTYTIPNIVGKNVDAVARAGNFTKLYTFFPNADTNNFVLAGGSIEAGEEIKIFYHSGGAIDANGVSVIAQTSSARDADPAKNYNAPLNSIATGLVDFTATGDYNIALPSGVKMFVTAVLFELNNVYIISAQPIVELGTIVDPTLFETYLTIGTAEGDAKYNILSTVKAVTDLQARITVAATATTMEGRIVFIGVIIQDEA